MKKTCVVLLAIGFAATAMARYTVIEIMLKGVGLDYVGETGVEIYNGEKYSKTRYGIDKINMRACLVIDDEVGWMRLIEIEKGSYTEWDADADTDFDNEYQCSYDDRNFDDFSGSGVIQGSSRGLESLYFHFSQPGIMLHGSAIGAWKEAWKDVYHSGWEWDVMASSWKVSYQARGCVLAEIDGEADAYGSIRMKLNQKVSDAMWLAWYFAGGELNEAAGVAAAEDILNSYINGKARIDNADIDLPEL